MTIFFNQHKKPILFGPVISKNEFYHKIWLCKLFEIYICKKSEKSNAQILRKAVNRYRDKQVERQIMFYSTVKKLHMSGNSFHISYTKSASHNLDVK